MFLLTCPLAHCHHGPVKPIVTPIILFAPFFFCLCGGPPESAPGPEGPPKRLVSLSPAITRQIQDLESEDLIVGVTTYGPEMKKKTAVVGSLVRPGAEAIALLKPDLILMSDEDSAVQRTELIVSMGIPIKVFKKNADFESICENYLELAGILGKSRLAGVKLAHYRSLLEKARKRASGAARPRVAVFISSKPLIAASDRSFIGGAVRDAGGENCYSDVQVPYPSVSLESLAQRSADAVVAISGGDIDAIRSDLGRYGVDVKRIRWVRISPDRLTQYTPADYAGSVDILSGILHPDRGR